MFTNYECKKLHMDVNGVCVYTQTKNAAGIDTKGHVYNIFHQPDHETSINIDTFIQFQHGPIKEVGVTGVTSEALLVVLLDRTQVLDERFPCQENKEAIEHLQKALAAFNNRTKDRQSRGVEGLNKA